MALAEAFDATLLTMDERLARAHGPTCRIRRPSRGVITAAKGGMLEVRVATPGQVPAHLIWLYRVIL